jgi:two-component system response regulator AtoC
MRIQTAMKEDGADFVFKPFEREQNLFTVREQIAASARAEVSPAAHACAAVSSGSRAMNEVRDLIRRAAVSTATVLVRGESGTGKELVARAIHDGGPRAQAPFVKIHCGALPDTLIESELFGYEKGAFTGAASRKPGRIELAEGGTVFLDEIGDVSPVVQVKLLRLLQDREFERLGGTQTLKLTARIVAATHQPLEDLIKAQKFREDLFYRLNVLPIWMPALRDRATDIAALARHFCRAFGDANGRGPLALAGDAIAILQRQAWPGNVRELQNFIERLVVLSDGDALTAADVARELARRPPAAGASPVARPAADRRPAGAAVATLESSRRDAEREAIVTALEESANNRVMAARLLGISRRNLYRKLGEHGLL